MEKTYLAGDFDLILEDNGKFKAFSLYKEKRFTRLGYKAGVVYDCLPYFVKYYRKHHGKIYLSSHVDFTLNVISLLLTLNHWL